MTKPKRTVTQGAGARRRSQGKQRQVATLHLALLIPTLRWHLVTSWHCCNPDHLPRCTCLPPHPHLPPAVRAGCHFTRPKIRYSVGGGNSGGPDRRGGERRAHTENHWPWRRRLGELVEDRLVRENWAVAMYGREFRLRRRGLRSEPADG